MCKKCQGHGYVFGSQWPRHPHLCNVCMGTGSGRPRKITEARIKQSISGFSAAETAAIVSLSVRPRYYMGFDNTIEGALASAVADLGIAAQWLYNHNALEVVQRGKSITVELKTEAEVTRVEALEYVITAQAL